MARRLEVVVQALEEYGGRERGEKVSAELNERLAGIGIISQDDRNLAREWVRTERAARTAKLRETSAQEDLVDAPTSKTDRSGEVSEPQGADINDIDFSGMSLEEALAIPIPGDAAGIRTLADAVEKIGADAENNAVDRLGDLLEGMAQTGRKDRAMTAMRTKLKKEVTKGKAANREAKRWAKTLRAKADKIGEGVAKNDGPNLRDIRIVPAADLSESTLDALYLLDLFVDGEDGHTIIGIMGEDGAIRGGYVVDKSELMGDLQISDPSTSEDVGALAAHASMTAGVALRYQTSNPGHISAVESAGFTVENSGISATGDKFWILESSTPDIRVQPVKQPKSARKEAAAAGARMRAIDAAIQRMGDTGEVGNLLSAIRDSLGLESGEWSLDDALEEAEAIGLVGEDIDSIVGHLESVDATGSLESAIEDVQRIAIEGSGKLHYVTLNKDEHGEMVEKWHDKHHSTRSKLNPRYQHAVAVMSGKDVVAIATIGTPSGRWGGKYKGNMVELQRIISDGSTRNASSAAASAAVAYAKSKGKTLITYSEQAEAGSTYKALGSPRKDGYHMRPTKLLPSRESKAGEEGAPRIRWEAGPLAGEAINLPGSATQLGDSDHIETLSFASGVSRSPGDIRKEIANGNDVGVAVWPQRLSNVVVKLLVDHVKAGGSIFVDSGAFSEATTGVEPDWDAVFTEYDRILGPLSPRRPSWMERSERERVFIIAPDKLGGLDRTAELRQSEIMGKFNGLLHQGARVIYPAQRDGDNRHIEGGFPQFKSVNETILHSVQYDLDREDDQGYWASGRAIIGIPYNKAPWTQEEVIKLIKDLSRQDSDPGYFDPHIHLLGGGVGAVQSLVDAVREQGLAGNVAAITGDAGSRIAMERAFGKGKVAVMPQTAPDMFGETKEKEGTRVEVVEDAGAQGAMFQEDTGERGQTSILDSQEDATFIEEGAVLQKGTRVQGVYQVGDKDVPAPFMGTVTGIRGSSVSAHKGVDMWDAIIELDTPIVAGPAGLNERQIRGATRVSLQVNTDRHGVVRMGRSVGGFMPKSAAAPEAKKPKTGRQLFDDKIAKIRNSESTPFIVWVRAQGGVENDRGDLDNFTIREDRGMRKGVFGLPALVQPKGKGVAPDDLLRMMEEDGWIVDEFAEANNPIDTITDFIERNPNRLGDSTGEAEWREEQDALYEAGVQSLVDEKGKTREEAEAIMADREAAQRDDRPQAYDDDGNFTLFSPPRSRSEIAFSVAPATDSAAFKKWFKQSAVVDADGKPQRVYHGTGESNLTVFRPSKEGKLGSGIYLTPDRETAQRFAERRGTGGKAGPVIEVYVNIGHPLYARIEEDVSEAEAVLIGLGYTYEGAEEKALELEDESEGIALGRQGALLQKMVESAGHDGIILLDEEGEMAEIVAFSPTQIKSATGNRGTFDANNPDIRRAPKGDVEQLTPEQVVDQLSEVGEYATAGGDASVKVTINDLKEAYQDIVKAIGGNSPIRVGGVRGTGAAGYYKMKDHVIHILDADDIVTMVHEIGHALEFAIWGDYWYRSSKKRFPKVAAEVRAELLAGGKRLYRNGPPSEGNYTSEGWAEFVRALVTNPVEASRMYPKTLDWAVREAISPELLDGILKAQSLTRDYYRAGDIQRKKNEMDFADSQGGVRQTWADYTSDRINWISDWVDSGVALQELDDALLAYKVKESEIRWEKAVKAAKEAGEPLPEKPRVENIRLLPSESIRKTHAALEMSHSAIAAHMAESAMVNIHGVAVKGVKPLHELRKIINPKEWKDFAIFLWARRALALGHIDADTLKPISEFEGKEPRAGGMRVAEAERIIVEYQSNDDMYRRFIAAASIVYRWNDGVLSYAAGASPEMARAVEYIRKGDPGNYAPLWRDLTAVEKAYSGAGASAARTGSVAKRLKGSLRGVKNPIVSMLQNAERIVKATHDRVILDRIVALHKMQIEGSKERGLPGIGHLIEKVPTTITVDHTTNLRGLLDKLKELLNKQVGDVKSVTGVTVEQDGLAGHFDVDVGVDEMNTDALVQFFSPTMETKDDVTFTMVEEGKIVQYVLKSRNLYKALHGATPDEIENIFLRAIAFHTKLWRLSTVAWRMSFGIIANPQRDIRVAWIQSRAKDRSAAEFATDMIGMMASAPFYYALRGRPELHDKLPKWVFRNLEWLDMFVRMGGEIAQPVGADINYARRAASRIVQSQAQRLMDPRNWLDMLATVVQIPEGAIRAQELKAVATRMGIKPEHDLTADQAIALKEAFSEVTVNFRRGGHMARQANRYSPFFTARINGLVDMRRAYKRDPVSFFLRGFTTLTLPSIAAHLMLDDEEWYKEIPPSERFMVTFMKLGDDTVARIRLPHEYGTLFAALPVAMIASAQKSVEDGDVDGSELTAWLGAVKSQLTPDAPPVLSEIAEQLANKDFYFDQNIVPRRQMGLPEEEQFGPYTSMTAKFLGNLTGESPKRIDHIITGILGQSAADFVDAYEAIPRALWGGEQRDFEPTDMPVIGSLYRRGGTDITASRTVDLLYKMKEQADMHSASERTKETAAERQRRLLVTDATRAIGLLSWVRTHTTNKQDRTKVSGQIVDIAKRATKAYGEDVYMSSGDSYLRQVFRKYKSRAEDQKERMERRQRVQ